MAIVTEQQAKLCVGSVVLGLFFFFFLNKHVKSSGEIILCAETHVLKVLYAIRCFEFRSSGLVGLGN